jgi:hypothetical protein
MEPIPLSALQQQEPASIPLSALTGESSGIPASALTGGPSGIPVSGLTAAPAGIPGWVGPQLTTPITSLKGGLAYQALLEDEAAGRAGFWESATPGKRDIPFIGDVIAGIDIAQIPSTAKKLRAGLPIGDQELLDFNLFVKQSQREANRTFLGDLGAGLKNLVTFGLEFSGTAALVGAGILAAPVTGGASAAGAAGVAGSVAAKKLAKEGILTLAQKEARAAAAKLAISGASKGMQVATANRVAFQSALKGVNAATQELVKSALGSKATTFIGRNVARGAGGLATMGAGAAAMTGVDEAANLIIGAPFGGAPTYNQVQRELGAASRGEEMSSSTAHMLELGDRFAEYFSELSGPYIGKTASAIGAKVGISQKVFEDFGSKMAKKITEFFGPGVTKSAQALSDEAKAYITQKKWISATGAYLGALSAKYNVDVKAAAEIFRQTGYDGFKEEIAEERVGGFIRGLTGISGDDWGLRNAFDQMVPTLDEFATEVAVFATPLALAGGVFAAQNTKFMGGRGLRGMVQDLELMEKAVKPLYETRPSATDPAKKDIYQKYAVPESEIQASQDAAVNMVKTAVTTEGQATKVFGKIMEYASRLARMDWMGMQYNSLDRLAAAHDMPSLVSFYQRVYDAQIAEHKSESRAEAFAEGALRELMERWQGAAVLRTGTEAEQKAVASEIQRKVEGNAGIRWDEETKQLLITDPGAAFSDASADALKRLNINPDRMSIKQAMQYLDLASTDGAELSAVVLNPSADPAATARIGARFGYNLMDAVQLQDFRIALDFYRKALTSAKAVSFADFDVTFVPRMPIVEGTRDELEKFFGYTTGGGSFVKTEKTHPTLKDKKGEALPIYAAQAGASRIGGTVFVPVNNTYVRELETGKRHSPLSHLAEDHVERTAIFGENNSLTAPASELVASILQHLDSVPTAAKAPWYQTLRKQINLQPGEIASKLIQRDLGWHEDTGHGETSLAFRDTLAALPELDNLLGTDRANAVRLQVAQLAGFATWADMAAIWANPFVGIGKDLPQMAPTQTLDMNSGIPAPPPPPPAGRTGLNVVNIPPPTPGATPGATPGTAPAAQTPKKKPAGKPVSDADVQQNLVKGTKAPAITVNLGAAAPKPAPEAPAPISKEGGDRVEESDQKVRQEGQQEGQQGLLSKAAATGSGEVPGAPVAPEKGETPPPPAVNADQMKDALAKRAAAQAEARAKAAPEVKTVSDADLEGARRISKTVKGLPKPDSSSLLSGSLVSQNLRNVRDVLFQVYNFKKNINPDTVGDVEAYWDGVFKYLGTFLTPEQLQLLLLDAGPQNLNTDDPAGVPVETEGTVSESVAAEYDANERVRAVYEAPSNQLFLFAVGEVMGHGVGQREALRQMRTWGWFEEVSDDFRTAGSLVSREDTLPWQPVGGLADEASFRAWAADPNAPPNEAKIRKVLAMFPYAEVRDVIFRNTSSIVPIRAIKVEKSGLEQKFTTINSVDDVRQFQRQTHNTLVSKTNAAELEKRSERLKALLASKPKETTFEEITDHAAWANFLSEITGRPASSFLNPITKKLLPAMRALIESVNFHFNTTKQTAQYRVFVEGDRSDRTMGWLQQYQIDEKNLPRGFEIWLEHLSMDFALGKAESTFTRSSLIFNQQFTDTDFRTTYTAPGGKQRTSFFAMTWGINALIRAGIGPKYLETLAGFETEFSEGASKAVAVGSESVDELYEAMEQNFVNGMQVIYFPTAEKNLAMGVRLPMFIEEPASDSDEDIEAWATKNRELGQIFLAGIISGTSGNSFKDINTFTTWAAPVITGGQSIEKFMQDRKDANDGPYIPWSKGFRDFIKRMSQAWSPGVRYAIGDKDGPPASMRVGVVKIDTTYGIEVGDGGAFHFPWTKLTQSEKAGFYGVLDGKPYHIKPHSTLLSPESNLLEIPVLREIYERAYAGGVAENQLHFVVPVDTAKNLGGKAPKSVAGTITNPHVETLPTTMLREQLDLKASRRASNQNMPRQVISWAAGRSIKFLDALDAEAKKALETKLPELQEILAGNPSMSDVSRLLEAGVWRYSPVIETAVSAAFSAALRRATSTKAFGIQAISLPNLFRTAAEAEAAGIRDYSRNADGSIALASVWANVEIPFERKNDGWDEWRGARYDATMKREWWAARTQETMDARLTEDAVKESIVVAAKEHGVFLDLFNLDEDGNPILKAEALPEDVLQFNYGASGVEDVVIRGLRYAWNRTPFTGPESLTFVRLGKKITGISHATIIAHPDVIKRSGEDGDGDKRLGMSTGGSAEQDRVFNLLAKIYYDLSDDELRSAIDTTALKRMRETPADAAWDYAKTKPWSYEALISAAKDIRSARRQLGIVVSDVGVFDMVVPFMSFKISFGGRDVSWSPDKMAKEWQGIRKNLSAVTNLLVDDPKDPVSREIGWELSKLMVPLLLGGYSLEEIKAVSKTPIFKEYARQENLRMRSDRKISSMSVLAAAAKQEKSEFSEAEVKELKALNSIANRIFDLRVMLSVPYEGAASLADLHEIEQSFDQLDTDDMAPMDVAELKETGRGAKILARSRQVLSELRAQYYDAHPLNSKAMRDFVNVDLRYEYKRDASGMRVPKVDENGKPIISDWVSRETLNSFYNEAPYVLWARAQSRAVPAEHHLALKSLHPIVVEAWRKAFAADPKNTFLAVLRPITRFEKNKSKSIVLQTFERFTEIDEARQLQMWRDFDRLPLALQELLGYYAALRYGPGRARASGSYVSLMSPRWLAAASARYEAEAATWATELTPEQKQELLAVALDSDAKVRASWVPGNAASMADLRAVAYAQQNAWRTIREHRGYVIASNGRQSEAVKLQGKVASYNETVAAASAPSRERVGEFIFSLIDSAIDAREAGLKGKKEKTAANRTRAKGVEAPAAPAASSSKTPEFDKLPSYVPGQRTLTYAGVGSRETPPPVLAQMKLMAQRLAAIGYTLRSGGARGADTAFESGATKKEIFKADAATAQTRAIALEIHPRPKALADFAIDLMARNTNQLFGAALDSPVDFVLAWTPDGIESGAERSLQSGGTGQAIDMASRKGIPVINMNAPGWEARLEAAITTAPAPATPAAAPAPAPAPATPAPAVTSGQILSGDLFSQAGMIPVITTNTNGVMGAGVAKLAAMNGLIPATRITANGNVVHPHAGVKALPGVVLFPVKQGSWDFEATVERIAASAVEFERILQQNPQQIYVMPPPGIGAGTLDKGTAAFNSTVGIVAGLLQRNPNLRLIIPDAETLAASPRGRLTPDQRGGEFRNAAFKAQVQDLLAINAPISAVPAPAASVLLGANEPSSVKLPPAATRFFESLSPVERRARDKYWMDNNTSVEDRVAHLRDLAGMRAEEKDATPEIVQLSAAIEAEYRNLAPANRSFSMAKVFSNRAYVLAETSIAGKALGPDDRRKQNARQRADVITRLKDINTLWSPYKAKLLAAETPEEFAEIMKRFAENRVNMPSWARPSDLDLSLISKAKTYEAERVEEPYRPVSTYTPPINPDEILSEMIRIEADEAQDRGENFFQDAQGTADWKNLSHSLASASAWMNQDLSRLTQFGTEQLHRILQEEMAKLNALRFQEDARYSDMLKYWGTWRRDYIHAIGADGRTYTKTKIKWTEEDRFTARQYSGALLALLEYFPSGMSRDAFDKRLADQNFWAQQSKYLKKSGREITGLTRGIPWGHTFKDSDGNTVPAVENMLDFFARWEKSATRKKLTDAGRKFDLYNTLKEARDFFDAAEKRYAFLNKLGSYAPHFFGRGIVGPDMQAAIDRLDLAVEKTDRNPAPGTTLLPNPSNYLRGKEKEALLPTPEQQTLYSSLRPDTPAPAEWTRADYARGILDALEDKEISDALAQKEAYAPSELNVNTIKALRRFLYATKWKEYANRALSRNLKGNYTEIYHKHGLKPGIMDITAARRTYVHDVYTAGFNRQIVNRFILTPDIDGAPLVIAVPSQIAGADTLVESATLRANAQHIAQFYGYKLSPKPAAPQLDALVNHVVPGNNYERMESPFPSVSYFYVQRGSAVKIMKHLVQEPARWMVGDTDLLEWLTRVVQWTKITSVGWSLFFPIALGESLVAGTGLRKNILYPSQLPKALDDIKKIMQDMNTHNPNNRDIVRMMVEEGIQLQEIAATDEPMGIADTDVEKVFDWMRRHHGDKTAQNARTFLRMWQGRPMSEFFFGKMFPAMKLWAAKRLMEDLGANMGIDMTKEENQRIILKRIAPIINDAYGGQFWTRYIWATPRVRQLLNFIMFAPNWTLSAWNIAGGGLITGRLLGNTMNKENVSFVFKQNWPAMYIIALTAVPAALQLAIWGATRLGGDPDDKPLPWLNEPGKQMAIDITPLARLLPWYEGDPTGRRRFYTRFGKQAFEVVGQGGWLQAPWGQFQRKLSQPVRTVIEQVTGKSPGSDFDLEFVDQGMLGWLKSKEPGFEGVLTSRLGYIAQKFLPMSALTLYKTPEAALMAFVAPVSKGMSMGKATEELTKILNTYADQDSWDKIKKSDLARTNLAALAPGLVSALEQNGYLVDKVINSAKGVVLGRLYGDFWAALDSGDEKALDKIANSILRVNGTLEGLERSISNKAKQYQIEVPPEHLEAARRAFE